MIALGFGVTLFLVAGGLFIDNELRCLPFGCGMHDNHNESLVALAPLALSTAAIVTGIVELNLADSHLHRAKLP